MNSLPIEEPQITIVVVPRERFSYTQASLESIYKYTEVPFKLVYIDGNSPAKIKTYLETQAQVKGFKLVRIDRYLPPNHARNIGLNYVDTRYLVFMDNDVVVSPGWLQTLYNCAEETEATVVGPLMCQDEPVHQTVHFAGGESRIVTDIKGKRHMREKMYKQGQQVAEVLPSLQRTETELAEFHCVLVRREIFDRIGNLDPQMLCTKEHLDFCITVREAGGKVYFEPAAIVTYVPGLSLELSDLHFYMLRWSDAWTLASLDYFREKWKLAEDGYFRIKYKKLGSRRKRSIIKPVVRKLKKSAQKVGIEKKQIENFFLALDNFLALDKKLNRFLTNQYENALFFEKSKTDL